MANRICLRLTFCLVLLSLTSSLWAQGVVVTDEMKPIFREMDKAYRAKNLRRADSLATAYLAISDGYHATVGYNCSQCKYVKAQYMRQCGRLNEALTLLDTVVAMRSKYFDGMGPSHLAIVYTEKSRVHRQLNQIDEAINNESHASDLFLKAGNKDSYVTTLINLANLYRQRDGLGDADKAYQCFLNASKKAKKGTPQYVISYNGVIRELYEQGQIAKADKQRVKLEKAAAKIYGENDVRYLQFLTNDAQNLFLVERYPAAAEVAERTASMYQQIGRTGNENYGKLLNLLGSCYMKLQDSRRAANVLKQALPVLKATLGERDGTYINTLNLLTKAYYDLGDRQKGDEYFQESSSALAANQDSDTKRYIGLQSLSQAETCASLGDYRKAIEFGHSALRVFERRGDSLDIGKTCNALARYYNHNNQPTKCDSIATLALRLAQRNKFHAVQAEALHLLASNATLETAVNYYQQSLSLLESNGMKQTPNYALILSDMARVQFHMNDFDHAINSARQAIDIHETVMGPLHADNVVLLFNLALYHHSVGNQDSVAHYYHRALDIQTQVVRNNFSFLSSLEREKNWNKNSYLFKISPLFINDVNTVSPSLLTDIYNAQLFTRGILLSSEIDFRKLLNATSPQVLSEYDELMSKHQQLQKFYSSNDATAQQSIEQLRKEIETLEHRIVRRCKEYGDFTHNLSLTVDSLSRNMHQGEIAVEIIDAPIRYNGIDDHLYMALIMQPGAEHPIVRRLFRQGELSELGYDKPIAQLLSGRTSDIQQWQNRIYSDARLGRLVWKPIFDAVPEGSHIYFSPTSIFYQWGIEYLAYDSEQQRACDVHPITRLSSTKLLAQQRPEPTPLDRSSVVLFGGMDYDMEVSNMLAFLSEEASEQNDQYLALTTARETEQVAQNVEATLRDGDSITELLGAAQETQTIFDMLSERNIPAKLYSFAGLEDRFKMLNGQKTTILHVATHGFSLPPIVNRHTTNVLGVSTLPEVDNSLCYSGLFFSGCNNVLGRNAKQLPEGLDNGVLTAQEVASLNLQGLELAVLSACQTGLGEIKEDGVIGLQRGFKKAGAQSLIISLWSVDDAATQLMMTTFYTSLMNGSTRQQAFRQAQNVVRSQYPEPHFWAPFIMLDNL